LTRPRNSSRDLQTLRLDWQSDTWEKDSRFQRLIVQATHPRKPTTQVAVLAGGPPSQRQAVTWMFSRWSQESNIGYQVRHVGIDELTSRASESYVQIAGQLQDRQVESRAHKEAIALKERTELDMGKALVRQRKALRRKTPDLAQLQATRDRLLAERERLIARYEELRQNNGLTDDEQVDDLLAIARRLMQGFRQTRSQEKAAARLTKLNEKIDELTVRLEDIDHRLKNVPATESRLEQLMEKGCVRLNTARKAFFDAIRITCCNIHLAAMDLYRRHYDNRRDDHLLLRMLTQAPGFLSVRDGVIHITLVPTLNVQPKARAALRAFIAELTPIINRTYDGRASPVVITMANGVLRLLPP
jgi:hypothetical protein